MIDKRKKKKYVHQQQLAILFKELLPELLSWALKVSFLCAYCCVFSLFIRTTVHDNENNCLPINNCTCNCSAHIARGITTTTKEEKQSKKKKKNQLILPTGMYWFYIIGSFLIFILSSDLCIANINISIFYDLLLPYSEQPQHRQYG